MALAVSLDYPWCPMWLLVFPGTTPTQALGWVEGPGHFLPPLLLPSPVPRVLLRDLPQRTPPPLHLGKLYVLSAYGGLETGHTSLRASSWSSCGYRGTSIWHVLPCWLPRLTSQYPVPVGGVASNALQCASLASLRAWTCGSLCLTWVQWWIWSGSWATKYL